MTAKKVGEKKKIIKNLSDSKKLPTFATDFEDVLRLGINGTIMAGPFVYRLGRKIFILERGVRFSYGLRNAAGLPPRKWSRLDRLVKNQSIGIKKTFLKTNGKS